MSDIVERLRATRLDKDNFPRMDSERWCSVGLACEAADEIERLTAALMSAIADNARLTRERDALRAAGRQGTSTL